MKKIKTLDQLKKLASTDEGIECNIILNGGIGSRKHIYYDNKRFYIWNYIDDSEQKLTEKAIMDTRRTNVGEAIIRGALMY